MGDFVTRFQQLDPVEEAEPLARYLAHSNHFKGPSVTHRAFLPHPDTNDVSVYRIKGLRLKRVWALGDRQMTRKFYGIGKLKRRDVALNKPLDVVPDKKPKRHANIVGWPPKTEKARHIMYAKKLAAASTLLLRT